MPHERVDLRSLTTPEHFFTDPDFASAQYAYEVVSHQLKEHLPKAITMLWHGSTSIPDIPGKNILDVACYVHHQDLDDSVQLLTQLGYNYNLMFNYKIGFFERNGRFLEGEVIIDDRPLPVNLLLITNPYWFISLTRIKDYFKKSPEARKDYIRNKQSCVATLVERTQAQPDLSTAQTRMIYTKGKKGFIREILLQSLRECPYPLTENMLASII